jgi:glutaminase
MNYVTALHTIFERVQQFPEAGRVTQYIPQLESVSPDKFGVHLQPLQGEGVGLGDFNEKFSIQSIVKVMSLTLAFQQLGETLWERVGVEPSGNPFNSLWQLEYEKGIPRNPLINSGAIVVCDILCTLYKDPWEEFIRFVRHIAGDEAINSNRDVAKTERSIGYRNEALFNMMKASGNIRNHVDQVLELYYKQCAIEMSCAELSKTFALFANHGKLAGKDEQVITSSMAKRINAIMQTCGFYDEAGEYTFRVGLPGKSGIGGGIVALHPGKYAVAVWSPRLNSKGNSVKGMQLLEELTTELGSSIF